MKIALCQDKFATKDIVFHLALPAIRLVPGVMSSTVVAVVVQLKPFMIIVVKTMVPVIKLANIFFIKLFSAFSDS